MTRHSRGRKMRKIEKMLTRKKGCTAKELRTVLGWPSVSIPQRAKQLGLKLRSERRYWGDAQ